MRSLVLTIRSIIFPDLVSSPIDQTLRRHILNFCVMVHGSCLNLNRTCGSVSSRVIGIVLLGMEMVGIWLGLSLVSSGEGASGDGVWLLPKEHGKSMMSMLGTKSGSGFLKFLKAEPFLRDIAVIHTCMTLGKVKGLPLPELSLHPWCRPQILRCINFFLSRCLSEHGVLSLIMSRTSHDNLLLDPSHLIIVVCGSARIDIKSLSFRTGGYH